MGHLDISRSLTPGLCIASMAAIALWLGPGCTTASAQPPPVEDEQAGREERGDARESDEEALPVILALELSGDVPLTEGDISSLAEVPSKIDPQLDVLVWSRVSGEETDAVNRESRPKQVVCWSLTGTASNLGLLSEHLRLKLASELDGAVPEVIGHRMFQDLPAPSVAAASASVPSTGSLDAQGSETGPIVAILDTGVDYDHTVFGAGGSRLVSDGKCFSSKHSDLEVSSLCPTPSPAPPAQPLQGIGPRPGGKCKSEWHWCDHGTHTAGLVARNAADSRILSIQVNSKFDNVGFCHDPGPCVLSFESDRILALDWIFRQSEKRDGLRVSAVYLGQSSGAYKDSQACEDEHPCMKIAIENLWSKGIPVIVPAGNGYRRDAIGAPACIGKAISVGAADIKGAVAPFSNAAENAATADPFLDFLAPGVDVSTAVPDKKDAGLSGTSMAAANLAGAWAKLRKACPTAEVQEVLEALRSKSRKVDDQRLGGSAKDIPFVDTKAIEEAATEMRHSCAPERVDVNEVSTGRP